MQNPIGSAFVVKICTLIKRTQIVKSKYLLLHNSLKRNKIIKTLEI